jgi:hypothetical protein
MAAILYRSLTIARFWALLEAHAPFTSLLAEARRIEDTPDGWLARLVLRSVGDFPHVHIEMGDRFGGGPIPVTTFQSEAGTFGLEASDDWDEMRNSEFKINVFYELAGFDRQDELEMEIIAALEAGGRNLGYEPIVSWGPWTAKRGSAVNASVDQIARPVTQFLIPVRYEFTGAQLTPDSPTS